jgi:formiminoglutamase
MTRIRSARISRACSTENCRCSIWEPTRWFCSPLLRQRLAAVLAAGGASHVLDGRFKGGWITRSFGRPDEGVEAVQMELGCRAYMAEPDSVGPAQLADAARRNTAAPTRAVLKQVLQTLLAFVGERQGD